MKYNLVEDCPRQLLYEKSTNRLVCVAILGCSSLQGKVSLSKILSSKLFLMHSLESKC